MSKAILSWYNHQTMTTFPLRNLIAFRCARPSKDSSKESLLEEACRGSNLSDKVVDQSGVRENMRRVRRFYFAMPSM